MSMCIALRLDTELPLTLNVTKSDVKGAKTAKTAKLENVTFLDYFQLLYLAGFKCSQEITVLRFSSIRVN